MNSFNSQDRSIKNIPFCIQDPSKLKVREVK